MGYIEVFHMDSEGAGWLDLSDIPAETLLELELGLFNEGALFYLPTFHEDQYDMMSLSSI